MSNITGIIPFTEIFERSMVLSRDNSVASEDKFKGLVNDAYTKDIPREADWDFLLSSTSIVCSAYYRTGTVSIVAGAAALTGVGTTWVAAMTTANGWKIKFAGNNLIYDFTFVTATTATIAPVLSGDVNITAGGYILFRDTYSLASDFSRFLLGDQGGLKVMRSGKWDIAPVTLYTKWQDDFSPDASDSIKRCRLLGWDSSRNRRCQINPPSQKAIALPYDYIMVVPPMTEYTTGYISVITNGATGVTGSGTAWNVTANLDLTNYTYYFRRDSDGTGDSSVWYLISTVGGATSITLASNYGGASITAGVSTDTYTISRIPIYPSEFHDMLIYSSAMNGIADQGDPNYIYFASKAKDILDKCKSLYRSRNLSGQASVEDVYR